MHQTPHIIHRQLVEVVFEKPGETFGMQERLAETFHQRIEPALNEVFDEFEDKLPDGIMVPALSVDCGILHNANWEEELVISLCDKIRDELRRYGAVQGDKSKQYDWNEEFFHFLRTGRPQWDSQKKHPADYEGMLVLDTLLLDTLTIALQTSTDVLTRLLHYCTTGFIASLARLLVADRVPPEVEAYLTFLEQAGVAEDTWSTAIIGTYHAVYCQSTTSDRSAEQFITGLTERIWPTTNKSQQAKIKEQIKQYTGGKGAAITGERTMAESRPSTESPQVRDVHATEKKTDTAADIVNQPETSYYISNAGLVLTYPFIVPLLQRNGLLDDTNRLLPADKGKAAVLLQHLINESPVTDEGELLLNKILVGLQPISFVDPSVFEYSTLVQHQCEDVLHAVIEHWTTLRNTSVAGLRNTFLVRDGKLTTRTTGWLLQVDSHGVDVLLSSLPWPLGIIKLPWMENILHVEWA